MKNLAAQERIVPLKNTLDSLRHVVSRSVRDRKFVKSLNAESKITAVPGFDFKVFSGDYLVSGDRGIYAIRDGKLLNLFGTRTFGIAIRGTELFTASSNDHYSSICKAVLPDQIAPGASLKFTELFRTPTSKSGRIHQIGFFNDQLAVAHTDANAILFLNPETGDVISQCQPFRDHFGLPIGGDYNHINSVSQCGECLLFCAYRAGENSLICVLHENRVKGYAVPNTGAHDIHLTGETLYYSDTFGRPVSAGGDECGYLMANGHRVDEAYFSKPPGRAVRGIAGSGDELLVGHSHKGPRAKRYKGSGSVFRIVGGKVVHEVVVPFSQVYDILRLDGRHFEEPPRFKTWDELNRFLSATLGPCAYERELD
jgi:hypothetical protein